MCRKNEVYTKREKERKEMRYKERDDLCVKRRGG